MKKAKKDNLEHILSALYKIKKINRKKQYTEQELIELVSNDPAGQNVIKQLQEMKVSSSQLFNRGYYLASTILEGFID